MQTYAKIRNGVGGATTQGRYRLRLRNELRELVK